MKPDKYKARICCCGNFELDTYGHHRNKRDGRLCVCGGPTQDWNPCKLWKAGDPEFLTPRSHVRVEQNQDSLHIHQQSYTKELLKKFGYTKGIRSRTTTAAPKRFGQTPPVPPDPANQEHKHKIQYGQQVTQTPTPPNMTTFSDARLSPSGGRSQSGQAEDSGSKLLRQKSWL
eukprot:3424941-Amphidinium_carterae.6